MEQLYKLGIYDDIVIAFYFIFMLTVGFVFSRSSKNSSEHLRGGGSMTWWMTSGSVYMAAFSAWPSAAGCIGFICVNAANKNKKFAGQYGLFTPEKK